MKTQLRLLTIAFLSVLVFNSCSEDNDSNNDTGGDLLGAWDMAEFNYSGTSSAEFQGIDITTEYDGVGTNIDAQMNITENPNEILFSGSYDIDLTVMFQGQTQTQTFPIDNAQSVSTWTRSGNTLTVEGEFVSVEGTDLNQAEIQTQEYIIEELTDDTLVLTTTTVQEINQQGVTSTVTVDLYARFTR